MDKSSSGRSFFIGSVMDNIPENAALGITLPSTNDMKSSEISRRHILVLWSLVIVIGTLATTIGYAVLSNTSPPIISIFFAFAAGAILVMLGESMIPEAFRKEGFGKGLALLAGFLVALILTKAQGG
jgi:ZIP family zinc transporter